MGERMKMKQEKAEALKQTILNVAYELFLTHGDEKVCLADIEQGAGATRGSLIYHYRSKETLLLLTSEKFIADFFRDTCPDEEVINSRTPLKDYLKAFVQMVEAQVRHFKENIVKDTKVTSASSINFRFPSRWASTVGETRISQVSSSNQREPRWMRSARAVSGISSSVANAVARISPSPSRV